MKILTVDDSCSMRQMVRSALEAEGYEVSEADNGESALAVLEIDAPDLVITDLYMPTMDGLSLLRAIRELPRHKFTPVLLLTTEHGEEMKQRGRASGATGWLVKPFDPTKLIEVIGKVIR